MQTNIIKVLLLIMMTALSTTKSFAQTTVEFSYDTNGNRVLRQITIGGDKNAKDYRNLRGEETPSTTDNFESMSVALYPNPTDGQFVIETKDCDKSNTLRATLITPTGEVIQDLTLVAQQVIFDLTHYPAGIYLLKLTVGTECHVWQIIKK